MPFFDDVDPPPRRPEPVEYRSPPWVEPPVNVIPATVALDVVLVRTPEWAVWVGDGAAFPTGVAFTVTAQCRSAEWEPGATGPVFDDGVAEAARLGVGFADGRKAFAGDRFQHQRRFAGEEAKEIVLWPRGGMGGRRRWSRTFWLWPLPPPGPLTFALSWPAEGIEETTVEVDAGPIRDAAGRAVELWPDDRPLPPPEGGGSWTSYAPG
jgi:hypothetical protein